MNLDPALKIKFIYNFISKKLTTVIQPAGFLGLINFVWQHRVLSTEASGSEKLLVETYGRKNVACHMIFSVSILLILTKTIGSPGTKSFSLPRNQPVNIYPKVN